MENTPGQVAYEAYWKEIGYAGVDYTLLTDDEKSAWEAAAEVGRTQGIEEAVKSQCVSCAKGDVPKLETQDWGNAGAIKTYWHGSGFMCRAANIRAYEEIRALKKEVGK